MTRRDALKGIAAGAVVSTGCTAHRERSRNVPRHRPNVLVVFADQWRGMDVGCFANHDVITPNIDALAREGIVYENAYANCPLCTPSRGQFLTGRYPHALGLVTNDLAIHPDEVSIARVLGAAGYRCGYIGKWHLDGWPRDKFTPPGSRRLGFDDYWAVWNCGHDYFTAKYYLDTPEPVLIEGYEPDHQTDLAVDFIEQHCDQYQHRPFCLFLSYGPPHAPYHLVPARFAEMYDPDKLTLRPNCRGANRRTIADYYAAITALDENMGRLMAALDRAGIAEQTIVLLTSDHGDMLWSQGNTKKQQPWDESIRVPLIIRYPSQVKAGQTSETLISMADIMPTMLGLAGHDIPRCVQGRDLSWSALGENGQEPSSVYLMELCGVGQATNHGVYTWRGVRTRRYVYAEDCRGPWLLYDCDADPYEVNNLVGSPDHADARKLLAAELRGWYERLGERYLPAVEQARQLGRYEELAALFDAVVAVIGRDNPEVKMLEAYMADGGNWPNRRF